GHPLLLLRGRTPYRRHGYDRRDRCPVARGEDATGKWPERCRHSFQARSRAGYPRRSRPRRTARLSGDRPFEGPGRTAGRGNGTPQHGTWVEKETRLRPMARYIAGFAQGSWEAGYFPSNQISSDDLGFVKDTQEKLPTRL